LIDYSANIQMVYWWSSRNCWDFWNTIIVTKSVSTQIYYGLACSLTPYTGQNYL